MTARLERDVDRAAAGLAVGARQGLDFRMSLAKLLMPSLGDDLLPLHDHAADHRVRLNQSFAAAGELESPAHHLTVEIGESRHPGYFGEGAG